MIKTLKVNNSSFANFGSVAIQPLITSLVTQAVNHTQVTHPSSIGILPTSQVHLSHPIMLHLAGNIQRFATPSLHEIGQHIIAGRRIILPIHTRFNTVLPVYHLSLDAGKEYDPRLNQGFTTTTTKFQPYEQLTGIAQERPEVIMMTNFDPLFNRDVHHSAPWFIPYIEAAGIEPYMTDAGRFLDSQIQMRNLKHYNSRFLVRTLWRRYGNIFELFRNRKDTLQNALNNLSQNSSFLLNLVRIIEAQKAQLDLRHDVYTVDPNQVGSLLNANYVQATVNPQPEPNQRRRIVPLHFISYHPLTFDPVDVLSDLGYKPATLRETYASTKIWMQTLLETSYALKFHTLPFLDIDPSYQRNDVNPTTILNPRINRFSLSTNVPNLPPLSELISLQPSLAAQSINVIKPAFTTIYQNVLFKDEEARIAALAHLLSAEYRYSYGLTFSNLKSILLNTYDYTVSPGIPNTTVFDNIFGRFGNNISDFPQTPNFSLSAMAQRTQNNVGVLTFESKYLEGDTGTLSPGGDFFFDQLLQPTNNPNPPPGVPAGLGFNTTNIDDLARILDDSYNSFNVVIDYMNLLQKPYVDHVSPDIAKKLEGSIMDTTTDLLTAVKKGLVDANGNTSKMLQDDRLASVFAFARKDNGVKTALFLYVLAKISRSYNTFVPFFTSNTTADNTPLVDTLIAQVNTQLQADLPHTRAAVQMLGERGFDRFQRNSSSALNPQGVATALKAGTPLTNYVINLMGEIITRFQQTRAVTNSFTIYGGYLDTIVAMVAFDLITSAIARYGSLNLTGVTQSGFNPFFQGTVSYVVSQTTTQHSASVNELMARAVQENVRVQRLVMAILHVLQTLSGSLKGISNYLKSPPSVEALQTIAGILGNDQSLLNMLLSEQQIQMLAATTSNLIRAANEEVPPWQREYGRDTDDSQELKILDESEVPLAMRNAIYGYLGTSEFTSAKGANKRILTVGIPQGFTSRIKQKVNIRQQNRASFTNRRNDLVQVCVYKVDMVNSDIIYKPQRFLFEMSRFPVRSSVGTWLPLPARPTIENVVNAIPTMDFSQNADTSTNKSIDKGVEYASALAAQAHGLKNVQVAMSDDSYAFMSTQQKAEVLHNHVVSQILEAYVKLMTGINVAEYNFDMADVPPPLDANFVTTLTEHTVAHYVDQFNLKATAPVFNAAHYLAPVGGLMFHTTAIDPPAFPLFSSAPLAIAQPQLNHPSGIAGFASLSSQLRAIQPATVAIKTLEQTQIVGNLAANLQRITPRYVPVMMHTFSTITTLRDTLSSASDPAALNQKVVTPKQFDRVFNVIVDPSDFEVDVVQTCATPYGREALNLMVKNGEIIPMTENQRAEFQFLPYTLRGVVPGSRGFAGRGPFFSRGTLSFRYRERDTMQGDLIADKYFITIETFDEGS